MVKTKRGVATANVRLGNDQQLEVWVGREEQGVGCQGNVGTGCWKAPVHDRSCDSVVTKDGEFWGCLEVFCDYTSRGAPELRTESRSGNSDLIMAVRS